MGMRKAPAVKLSLNDRAELERWSRARTLPVRQGVRARVLLLADNGMDDPAIAGALGVSRQRCGRIRARFLAAGLKALAADRPRAKPAQADQGAGHRHAHHDHPPGDGNGLKPRPDGQGGRGERVQRGADLASARTQAASSGPFQNQPRSPLRREAGGHRRALLGPAATCSGAVRGREKPDSGAGPHAAGAALAPRSTPAPRPTTINAMAPPPCSPPSTHWTAPS